MFIELLLLFDADFDEEGIIKLESKQESYKEKMEVINILNDEILDLLGQEEYENELTEILTKKDKHVEQVTKMRRCLDKVRIHEYTTTPPPPSTHRPMIRESRTKK